MDRLPERQQAAILAYLSIKQKFVRCAVVCQGWHRLLSLRASWNVCESLRIRSGNQFRHLDAIHILPPNITLDFDSDSTSDSSLVPEAITKCSWHFLAQVTHVSLWWGRRQPMSNGLFDFLVQECPHLKLVSISCDRLHDVPLDCAIFARLAQLESFSVSSWHGDTKLSLCSNIEALSACPLTELDIGRELTDKAMAKFAACDMPLVTLRTGAKLTAAGAVHLKKLPVAFLRSEIGHWSDLACLPLTLVKLELMHFDGDAHTAFSLSLDPVVTCCHQLTTLQLAGFHGWRTSLQPLQRCRRLDSLTLCYFALGIQDFKDIAAIKTLSKLHLDELKGLVDDHLLELQTLRLRKFTIDCFHRDGCSLTATVVGGVLAKMPLRDLWINAFERLDDSDLDPLLEHVPTLEMFGIACPHNLTETGRLRFTERGVQFRSSFMDDAGDEWKDGIGVY